jgi:hypothetical protein
MCPQAFPTPGGFALAFPLELLRAVFDVGYFLPNTRPTGKDGQSEDV